MAQDTVNRVNYLQAIAQELFRQSNHVDDVRLTTFYGYLTREVCLKNQISTFNWDSLKRQTCRRCFAPLIISKNDGESVKYKIKNKFLIVKCRFCGVEKRIKIDNRVKTHYEKALIDLESKSHDMAKTTEEEKR